MRRAPEFELATDRGTPGWPNEDFAAVAPGAAVLLDGCTTTPSGADTGCVHGVAWYARTLGASLLTKITAEPRISLASALEAAIAQVRQTHEGSCDLTVRATPAATVTAVRAELGGVSYLALSDSSIVADFGAAKPPQVISDTHRAAAADPAAARAAATGTIPAADLRGVVLLSDGATRITDLYHLMAWPAVIDLVRDQGPAALIRQVRSAEDADPRGELWPRYKIRDDATAIYWRPEVGFGQSR